LDQDPIRALRPLPKPKPDPRPEPRWLPWAIGSALFLAGFGIGWGGLGALIRRVEGTLPAPKAPQVAEAKVDGAEVTGAQPPITAQPGAQITPQWLITNRGTTTWTPFAYRFVPSDSTVAPIIALRPSATDTSASSVAPGETASVTVVLTVPATSGTWQPVWQLVGPEGPVPGSAITLMVLVRDDGG
jgi:hypothetical protein